MPPALRRSLRIRSTKAQNAPAANKQHQIKEKSATKRSARITAATPAASNAIEADKHVKDIKEAVDVDNGKVKSVIVKDRAQSKRGAVHGRQTISATEEPTKAVPSSVSTGRPKRACVRRGPSLKTEVSGSGSESSSAASSSESEIDDPDLELEIKKAKRKRATGVTIKERRESSSGRSASEDEASVHEEPSAKRARGKGIRQATSKARSQKTKAHNENENKTELRSVVRLLRKNYDVDYDEMVRWEARSVRMVRDLKELERERASGGQIMDAVNETIERCLRGRMLVEMDAAESVRVTRAHEAEVEMRSSLIGMTTMQRLKMKVANEQTKLEEEDDEEEDEWEAMELVEEEESPSTTKVEVTIESKRKLKAPWIAKWIRQEVNREVRQRCENIHKAHLLSYIAHLRHLMALAKSDWTTSLALSVLQPELGNLRKEETIRAKDDELKQWWNENFKRSNELESGESAVTEEKLQRLFVRKEYASEKEAAIMFISLIALIGIPARLIGRCAVVSKKPTQIEDGKRSKKADKKRDETGDVRYWCEVWSEEMRCWKIMNPYVEKLTSNTGEEESVHMEHLHACMEKNGPVLYFLAVDTDYGMRDVSSRYVNGKDFTCREWRGRRASEEWLHELWSNKEFRSNEARARAEDEELLRSLQMMELPKTVVAYKDHPLYVLDKDVLKMQIIFPYNTKEVGEIRGYKIYPRKFVRPVNKDKWYEKMGRQIKDGEPPCAEKQVTNPFTGETGMQGLYGYWQTEPWNGGAVKKGRLPRNEFGNVYLYQREMCPEGAVYVEIESMQRVALELGKDFVPAVIAWYYKGGNCIPLIRGAIYIKEDLPELVAQWLVSYTKWKEDERRSRNGRAMSRWKKLIKGMLRLAAMRREFEPIEHENRKGTTKLGDEEVKAEESVAWPQRKYGSQLFQA